MIFIFVTIISTKIILSLNYLNKINLIKVEYVNKEQRKIHQDSVVRIGSLVFVSLIPLIFTLNSGDITKIIIYSYIFVNWNI